jgi:hypothetical protein
MSSTVWESAPSSLSILVAARPAPHTARLVQFCCQRLLVVEPEFASAFHQELCGLAPEAIPAVPSGPALSGALAHCVLWAALARDRADVIEEEVRTFAAGQRALGFPVDAYRSLSHALLRAVRSTLQAGWTSEISSCWVSYALWLQPHLELGAGSALGGSAQQQTEEGLACLDVIYERLRAQYFAGQDRQLMAICTRVMLRTGADLRDPRPEQRTDPGTIAAVLESLLLMGFAPAAGPSTSAPGTTLSAPLHLREASDGPAAGPDQHASGRRRHWWGAPRGRTGRPDRSRPPVP